MADLRKAHNGGYLIRPALAAHTTMAFASIDDHARLPARFFAKLNAADGSLLRR